MFKLTIVLAVISVTLGAPSTLDEKLQIIGGRSTDISKHPWQVSLQYRQQHFCGGSLISPTWVLTAAHCITQGYQHNLNVRAGSSSKSSDGQISAVESYTIHPRYNDANGQMDHDIALLKLTTPITISTAASVKLPIANTNVTDNTQIVVTGWGTTWSGLPIYPDILQEVTVRKIPYLTCKQQYASTTTKVTSNMLCAGILNVGGKDACQGDSGGPASVNGIIVGVVSWGQGCGLARFAGVYAKVSVYRNWIKEVSGV